MRRDIAWSICVPSVVLTFVILGWMFANWQLPPALWEWSTLARAMAFTFFCLGVPYTFAMRMLWK